MTEQVHTINTTGFGTGIAQQERNRVLRGSTGNSDSTPSWAACESSGRDHFPVQLVAAELGGDRCGAPFCEREQAISAGDLRLHCACATWSKKPDDFWTGDCVPAKAIDGHFAPT